MSPPHPGQAAFAAPDPVQRWTPARLLDGAPDPYGRRPANGPEPQPRLAEPVPITGLIELG